MRHQYHHSTDIAPTILDAVGPQMPTVYRASISSLNGVSMRYSFDDAHAATTKRRYYAMLGTRGIWQDGWKASAIHAPISGKGPLRPGSVGALPRRRGPGGGARPRRSASRETQELIQAWVRGGRFRSTAG